MPPPPTQPTAPARLPTIFAALFGAFLALALLKFGNPPIMEKYVAKPANIYEFLLGSPWPIQWAYALLLIVLILGLVTAPWPLTRHRWLLGLPLVWLAWQTLAAAPTLDPALSRPTIAHFAAPKLHGSR